MGRKLRTEQRGIFPGQDPERNAMRDKIVAHELSLRAGLPSPEERDSAYENLGNQELPVFLKKEQIQKMIRDYQISMIEGPTGCGKSTQLAQFALEMGYKKIIYLEPRVHLADNLSDRLTSELNSQLGSEMGDGLVGVRHSERSNGYGKIIEIMTPDTFLRIARELQEYDDEPVLIIGDEIHEKDFATELAVGVAAEELEAHPKWRLALMSATLDADSVQSAYGDKYGKEVPRVSVEGRPHNLEIIEEPELTVEQVYEKYGADHQKTQMFVAGKQEIRDTTGNLRSMALGRTRITPFHARLSRAAVSKATSAQLSPGERQIIPSTNAGQSGITIPGQTLVISDGTSRRPDIDDDGVEGLFKGYCTRDELIQQAGRAGRDVPGGVFILCKPDDDNFEFQSLDDREPHAPAQIYHTNISRNVLAVASLGRDFYDLNEWLIHKVKPRRIIEAYEVLYRLGALDEQNEVTELGETMNKFPVRPEFSRAIAEAMRQGADGDMLRQLVAMVSSVEAGGLPYFEKGAGSAWRDDVRDETKDDYTAQLDMFIATRDLYDGKEVDESALEQRNYDLKNTKRAHRTYDKICRTLGLSKDDTPEAPTEEQIAELHDYLAAGLFDFAHNRLPPNESEHEAGYVSIYADRHTDPKRRGLSDRRIYRGEDPVVIGVPRRFEKHVKGGLEEFSVIEDVIPVTVKTLAKHALWLAEREPLPPVIVGGRLEQRSTLRLGTIKLGEMAVKSEVHHTPETRKILQDALFAKPTQTLKELIEIKREIEQIARLVPSGEIEHYFPNGMLTDEWLKQEVEKATRDDVDSVYTLDNKLRAMIVQNDISLESWISEGKYLDIIDRSPERMELGYGRDYKVHYSHGTPIINGFASSDCDLLPDDWKLPDGRVIFINQDISGNTKKYRSGELKRLLFERELA